MKWGEVPLATSHLALFVKKTQEQFLSTLAANTMKFMFGAQGISAYDDIWPPLRTVPNSKDIGQVWSTWSFELRETERKLRRVPLPIRFGSRGLHLDAKEVPTFIFHNKHIVPKVHLGQCDIPTAQEKLCHDNKLTSPPDV